MRGRFLFRLGNKVATKKLYWRALNRVEILMRRLPGAWKGEPLYLRCRRAIMDMDCVSCSAPILREELHASETIGGTTLHFCLDCVVPFVYRQDIVYAKHGPVSRTDQEVPDVSQ